MAATRATLPILHRFLGIGLTAIAAVSFVLKYVGVVPMLRDAAVTPMMSYVFSGISVVLAAVALLVHRPRVPGRAPGQSVEQYWLTPANGMKVLPVWFLLEGAGVLSVVGYMLTGESVSAMAMALLIFVFWQCGPNLFAKP